jgi:hypothetical protein
MQINKIINKLMIPIPPHANQQITTTIHRLKQNREKNIIIKIKYEINSYIKISVKSNLQNEGDNCDSYRDSSDVPGDGDE